MYYVFPYYPSARPYATRLQVPALCKVISEQFVSIRLLQGKPKGEEKGGVAGEPMLTGLIEVIRGFYSGFRGKCRGARPLIGQMSKTPLD